MLIGGQKKTYDYFFNTHGRNSYDNGGHSLLNFVHADLHSIDTRMSNDNAFWDGYKRHMETDQ